jgi:TonB-linked SusC/RagA family outer membrane protein
MRKTTLLLLTSLLIGTAYADPGRKTAGTDITQQSSACAGLVKDATGETVIGASVYVKGTTNGTITNIDGQFSLSGVKVGDVLVVSFVGYKTQEVTFDGQPLTITLEDDSQQLSEVVVTALGIKRQKRSLGYSTTSVGGENFTQARDMNLGNALSGKIAGVVVSGNATGAAGSSRVVIRGNASMTGNNQPLYVVDGVPLDNSNLGSAGKWGGMDMGDGLSNINSDDIANVQVLKGAAASALYGYRGGNGAILITTKSGQKDKKGVSVEFNNNLTFNGIYDYRDLQEVYGQGIQGKRPMTKSEAITVNTASWGDKIDGGKAVNFLGNDYNYSVYDNWNNFYRTGINDATSLAISGASDNITYRFGLSNVYDRSILPNAGISQQGINMNTTYDITPKLHLTVNANYVFENTTGRANLSDGNGNTNASLLYTPATFDIRWQKRGTPDSDWGTAANGAELIMGDNIYFNNPYWLQYRKTNETDKNRLTGAITLRYDITDYLYAQGAIQRDGYSMEFKQVQPIGASADPAGYLTEYAKHYAETNANYLIGFDKTFGDWTVGATIGGNRQHNLIKQWTVDGGRPFIAEGVWSANNLASHSFKKGYSEYQVNSVYGTADLGWKNQLFLNLTARNDWFSTLSPDNNSYLYPSATLSWVFSDTFTLPEWFTFGKIRGGYATASNGTSPYQTAIAYKIADYKVNGQSIAATNSSTYPNVNLKPVRISEIEAGLNLAFLNNRLSFDLAYYRKNTKDDIAVVTTSKTSGYSAQVMNIGEIENSGFEFLVNAVPVHTNDFEWNTTLNFATNSSEVVYLGEGVKSLSIDGAEARSGNVSVQNIVGQSYGQLVGYKYKRHNGQIVHKDGLAQHEDELSVLGSGVYKWTGGWNNRFTYKDFVLDFLVDFKFGAELFSGTNLSLTSSGQHKQTLQGRETSGNGTIVGNGVMDDGSGNYVKNTVSVPTQNYWQNIAGSNIGEAFIYDASFIKLREVSLGYNFPQRILGKLRYVKGLNVSLVARNLWTILKYTDNIDPESAYNNSNGQGLELNGYPATRSIGFNVNVKF